MRYLTAEEIIKINESTIKRFSPNETIHVIHEGALHASVENIQLEVFGRVMYPTIIDKAANLYKNLAQKHIFANANKRTAFTVLITMLKANGINIVVPQDEAVEFTVKIVTDHLEDDEIVRWIQMHIR